MDKKGKLTMRNLWDLLDRLEDLQRAVDEDLHYRRPERRTANAENTQRLALNSRLRLEDRMVRWYEMGGV